MKKIILLFSIVLSSSISFAQFDAVLSWSVKSTRTSPNKYSVIAATTVPAGWHLYGINTAADGLEPKLTFDYTNAKAFGAVAFNKPATVINDPAFENKKVSVYTGTVQVTQQVIINGIVPANLKVTLSSNIGSPTSFVPHDTT